jgi:large subunit ribosomal protein L15
MSLTLSTIKPATGSKKSKKIIGRGGKRGTYSGRGLKGQKARSGTSGFKRRGMKQLVERTPKLRGFKSRQIKPEIVNLSDLNKYFKDGDKVNLETLQKTGAVDKINNGVKILGKGELKLKNLEISQVEVSKGAKEAIEKLGGSVK